MQESHSSTSKYIKQNFTYQKGERDKTSPTPRKRCQLGHQAASAARWLVVGHWPAGTSPGAPAAAGPSFGLGVAAFQPNWATPSPLTTVRQQVLPPGVVPQLSVDMFRSIGFALRSF